MTGLPAWLAPLLDAQTMRGADRWAIEDQHIAAIELMERAGEGVVRTLERHAPDGPVTVLCGKGNNGGDGLVVARLLRERAREVTVVCVGDPAELRGDARVNLERLPGSGPVALDGSPWHAGREAGLEAAHGAGREARREAGLEAGRGAGREAGREAGRVRPPLEGAAVLVDALLGTGFEGEPRGAVREAIELIDASGLPVVSVDIPSGVDASSGEVAGAAVRAIATATFHAAKPGLWINPGKSCAGAVEVIDIGIPRGAPEASSIGLIEPTVLALLPVREPRSTKFLSGHVLLAGGSRGLTGAPAMAGRAAMRAGAGYVTLCVPAAVQDVVAVTLRTPELMTRGLRDEHGSLLEEEVATVLEVAARGGSLALGPGLGRRDQAAAFARSLARRADLPLVLDADGLNAHAGRLEELAGRREPALLTPHAGELGRLLGRDSSEIERHRLASAREAARRAHAIVLLKGDDTLVASPEGSVAVSRGASPALATAGTGDVLTGVLAALLAQRVEPFAAACAGVWLHAEAGRIAAARVGAAEGVIATDVIDALPAARARARTLENGRDG